jgi:putative ABC transport system substrate-binding protein
MMHRRTFLIGGACSLLAPALARAQEVGKVYRIGILPAGPLAPRAHQYAAFRRGLRDLGYVEGQNIALEFRPPAQEGGQFDGLAVELVRLKVDVIVATALATHAARRATSAIPIVMTSGQFDPVQDGLVSSLAHPGGNVTGMTNRNAELGPKHLQLLSEVVPGLSRVAVLINPNEVQGNAQFQHIETAARVLGVKVLRVEAAQPGALEEAFRRAADGRAGGLIVTSSPLFFGRSARIAELALKRRLPSISGQKPLSRAGVLLFYGPSDTESYRQAAAYVDKILRGAKPADLPVEQVDVFELVINLKTAKALGIKVPDSIMLRADEVIP